MRASGVNPRTSECPGCLLTPSLWSQLSFQQMSSSVSIRFSSLIQLLEEKQETTEVLLQEQQEETLSEAQARLDRLQDHSRLLQDSQAHLRSLRSLPDADLIKESVVLEVPRLEDLAPPLKPSLQDRLSPLTDLLSRLSKLVSDDLDKAVSAAVGQDREGKCPPLLWRPSSQGVGAQGVSVSRFPPGQEAGPGCGS